MKEYLAYEIEYDTDGEEVDLPAELTFRIPDGLARDDVEAMISDGISNTTGYCHAGFRFKLLEPNVEQEPASTFGMS